MRLRTILQSQKKTNTAYISRIVHCWLSLLLPPREGGTVQQGSRAFGHGASRPRITDLRISSGRKRGMNRFRTELISFRNNTLHLARE